METEGRIGFAGGWKRADGELMFNGDRVSVLQDESSSGHWLHNHMNVLDATELDT